MPPMNEIPSASTGIAIKIYFGVAILFIILAAVVIYFYPSSLYNPTTGQNATSTQSGTILSDAEKSRILDQLSEGATTTVSAKSKLQTLNQLQKQNAPSTVTDSDKLKLLESLK